jgi:hypothetical protein
MDITPKLSAKGWVVREAEICPNSTLPSSDPILVRGARREDNYFDYKHGFVYAISIAEAESYDKAHGY